nr:hypothetical protein GCM10020185_20270 [Pseudomonas brassicacearum subsp. brassicacearum]
MIRLGARVFTEQTLLAEITAQYLRSKGYDAQITGGLGSNLARSAHETGQLDMLWEYTGVSLVAYNHVTEKLDSAQSYARVKELDAKKRPGLADTVKIQQHLRPGPAGKKSPASTRRSTASAS